MVKVISIDEIMSGSESSEWGNANECYFGEEFEGEQETNTSSINTQKKPNSKSRKKALQRKRRNERKRAEKETDQIEQELANLSFDGSSEAVQNQSVVVEEKLQNGKKAKKKLSVEVKNEKDITKEVLRQYWENGQSHAASKNYAEAISCFTKALDINTNARLYGNRSHCYYELGEFQKALQDSLLALEMDDTYVVFFYRKGKALLALHRFSEAEDAFQKAIAISYDDEIQSCLVESRVKQLQDMGFPKEICECAIAKWTTVETAVENLFKSPPRQTIPVAAAPRVASAPVARPPVYKPPGMTMHRTNYNGIDDLDNSDRSASASSSSTSVKLHKKQAPAAVAENGFTTVTRKTTTTINPLDYYDYENYPPNMDFTNPLKISSLVALNVLQAMGSKKESLSVKEITELFQPYGRIANIVPNKANCFINYLDHQSASKAMANLQFHQVKGRYLRICFVDKNYQATKSRWIQEKTDMIYLPDNECFYFRVIGFCYRGRACDFRHIKENRGKGVPK